MIRPWQCIRSRQVSARRRLYSRRFLAAGVVVLAIVYVGLTNYVATQGYRLQTLQKEVTVLQRQSEETRLSIATSQSLQKLEAELPALALIPVTAVDYFAPTAVATR